jgi:hypothetical protein
MLEFLGCEATLNFYNGDMTLRLDNYCPSGASSSLTLLLTTEDVANLQEYFTLAVEALPGDDLDEEIPF